MLVSVVRKDPFEINGRRKYARVRARFPVSAGLSLARAECNSHAKALLHSLCAHLCKR